MSEKWSAGASMYVGRAAVGGSLSLTAHELRFFGGDNLTVPLQDIAAVRVARQTWWHPRKTVQVETRDVRSTWFLVNRQEEVASRIADAVEAAGGQAART